VPDRDETHHFDFDLDRAISEQVVERLEKSPLLPFEKGVGPQASGIYALYYRGTLVYIGKATKELTKSGRTLRARLNEHVGKLSKRQNMNMADLTCRFLTFESEWWVIAAEFALIVRYEPAWNESGFGSKTPGKGRPGTDRVSKFDQLFPKR
jgi:hypothetical protein